MNTILEYLEYSSNVLNSLRSLSGTVGGQQAGSLHYAMGGPSIPASSSAMWSCLHCTFMNQPGTEHCEMCSLPRS